DVYKRQLLAEAGHPDGFSIDFLVANPAPFPDIAQSMQATFAQAGVKLNLVLRDQAQVLATYRARGHELAFARWSPDYLDPHSTAEFFVRNPDNSDASTNKSAAWRNAWDIPELSAMTEKAMLERDPEVRKQIYKDEQKVVQENSPIIMMFQLVESTVSRKDTSGFTPGPGFDTAVFWNTRKAK
ncbi:MAG: ABC transporter substrate-binding protein, partial [Castellaniella sp.]